MSFRILFMGTPEFAVPILQSVYNSKHEILEVYTKPPQRKNRGKKPHNSPIHNCANDLKIKVRCPETLKENNELEYIKNLKPDIVLVVAYGKILPKDLLNYKKIHFLNVHASLLPKWRGAAPIQRAIMNMDEETGISIMKIEEKLDTGPVILKSKIKIDKNDNYIELSKKMSNVGARLILDTFELIEKKKENYTKQNEIEATYANKIEKSESKINWSENANKIIAKINALYPNPGSWFVLNGSRIKVTKAIEVKKKGKPGLVLGDNLTIGCLNNSIQILEIQKAGKIKMSTKEFLRGNEIKIGQNLN